MRHGADQRPILILLASLLATLLIALPAGPGTATAAPCINTMGDLCGTVYVRDSTKRYKVEPDVLKYAFGADTAVKFTKLRPWHHWSYPRTHAEGVLHYADCDPSCTQGTKQRTHVSVRLRHVHTCHGFFVYGRLHFHPRQDIPAQTLRIACSGAASQA